ncbi:hypothetical protein Tco_0377982 [Tanacetum coccineum]
MSSATSCGNLHFLFTLSLSLTEPLGRAMMRDIEGGFPTGHHIRIADSDASSSTHHHGFTILSRVTKSDPEEDPEEYEDDETEDGPIDYPMDGGDDGDDDNGDSSRDDANDEDEDEDEEDEEEEEEHLAPADSAVVVPTDEPVSPPEGIELVIPPPSTDITIGARISVRPQTSISLPPEAEVERLLAMTTPSPSPPISLSPPSAGERLVRCMAPPAHSSPPPVPSPLLPSSGCPTQIQTLRIASTQALIDVVTVTLPLPSLPPSLYILLPVDHRDDIPESEHPPRKILCLSTLGSRYEIGESSTARPTRDPAEAVPEIAPMTVEEVNTRVTELAELHEHDTQDLYALLEDAQDRDSMDGRGGGLCFPRGLGLLDRIESGDPSGASDPPYMRLAFKDEEAADVDVHLYRSMIGLLKYLTSSRPDIMFAICAYARDSPFDLDAFFDSDYAGASLDRKSIIGGCQFLRKRLITWQCKKQTIVANSTTEAEYVATANCCRQNLVFHSRIKHIEIRPHFIMDSYEKRLIQVIKIHTDHDVADLLTKAFAVSRFQYLIARYLEWNGTTAKDEFKVSVVRVTYYWQVYLMLIVAFNTIVKIKDVEPIKQKWVKDETVIKEWEDRMERDATTAFSLEAEWDSVLVYAGRHSLTAARNKLMLPGITYYRWAKTVNGEHQIQALVDKKKVIITEKSVRSDFMLEDAEGIECLPNDVIFE